MSVSICIPVYNGGEFLGECLRSVLAQTYHVEEILVCDDQSTDNSAGIIRDFAAQDSRIRLVMNEKNLGLAGNWNHCLELATCDWIKFVFQDDILSPSCIAEMLANAGNAPLVVCERKFIFAEVVRPEIKKYYEEDVLRLRNFFPGNESSSIDQGQLSGLAASYPSRNFIGEPTSVMFKRDMVKRYASFNTDLAQLCDLEYWLRIGCNEGLRYIPSELVYFRVHSRSVTGTNVFAGKSNRPRYTDPLILSHELLFSNYFSVFRQKLSWLKKKKLFYYFQTRLLEAKKNLAGEDQQNLSELLKKYQGIKKYYASATRAQLVLSLVELKRRMTRK